MSRWFRTQGWGHLRVVSDVGRPCFVGDFEGSTADVDVTVRGSLGFDVAGGAIVGESYARALQFMRLTTPAGPANAIFVTSADGPVTGSGMTIRMAGDGTTTGQVFSEFGVSWTPPA